MKNLNNKKISLTKYILFMFIAMFILSCEKEEIEFPYNTCIKGTVIGYEQCYNNVLIQVANYNVGSKATIPILNDLGHVVEYIVYDNVIKAPGGRIPDGLIYFIARKYNPNLDHTIVLCPLNIIPYNVPMVVITKYS